MTRALGEAAVAELERRFMVRRAGLEPRVFHRLTDNWLELSVRFIAPEHGVRDVKDAMNRYILAAFEQAGIEIASGTFEITGVPPIRVQVEPAQPPRDARDDTAA